MWKNNVTSTLRSVLLDEYSVSTPKQCLVNIYIDLFMNRYNLFMNKCNLNVSKHLLGLYHKKGLSMLYTVLILAPLTKYAFESGIE